MMASSLNDAMEKSLELLRQDDLEPELREALVMSVRAGLTQLYAMHKQQCADIVANQRKSEDIDRQFVVYKYHNNDILSFLAEDGESTFDRDKAQVVSSKEEARRLASWFGGPYGFFTDK
jgi:hypothetical protein